MKQKTAVEFLIEKLDQNFDYVADSIIEQAKEMEKNQIIDAFIGFDSDTEDNIEVAEEYYNQTYLDESKQ